MAEREAGSGLSRRALLKVSALVGGGLALGVVIPGLAQPPEESPPPPSPPPGPAPDLSAEVRPNAWIRIYGDGRIELVLARSEMGQGVMTSLPMLLAEELGVGLDQIQVVDAPVAADYVNRLLGSQATGGSTSLRDAWGPLREAGALGRALMIAAAAAIWQVPSSECRVRRGRVHHADGERSLGFAELAAKASELEVPEPPGLTPRASWTLLGSSQPRLDIPEKVSGAARFGLDVRLPGMLYASLFRCPIAGSRVDDWQGDAALRGAGVVRVLAVRNGIAVVAESTWAALRGRAQLEARCRPQVSPSLDTNRIRERLRLGLKGRSAVATRRGDVSSALAASAREIEAVYEVSFQAHACMEPMNCTADVTSSRCTLHVPTQAQAGALATASRITGLAPDRISVHTTFLGGGYGRRLEQDFVVDAVELSMQLRRPVQVIWTREDDLQHDYYRPMTLHRLRAGVGADGAPTAWFHRVVGPSVSSRVHSGVSRDGIDGYMMEGALDIPYAFPAVRVEYRRADTPVPVGYWHGGGYAHNSFAAECFVDELAQAAGQDPLAMRRGLLRDSPRHLSLLERVAGAEWGKPLAEGRGRGLSIVSAFDSLIAQVAEVSIQDGEARVHRVHCALDCGQVAHPDIVRGQIESGIAFGLTAALKGEISFTEGRVDQRGFRDYPLLGFGEMPEVSVDILGSEAEPGGVSGLAVPGIAPAVANALFALTGQRLRSLPLKLS